MADIGGYRHHVTGYPVMKDCYGTCAANCDDFLTGNCSSYRQYGETCRYDVRTPCIYPTVYGSREDVSNMTQSEVYNTGNCSDVYRMSANFRSDCPKMVQGQTSSAVEIYPWMKETRQNHRRQMSATLPGLSVSH